MVIDGNPDEFSGPSLKSIFISPPFVCAVSPVTEISKSEFLYFDVLSDAQSYLFEFLKSLSIELFNAASRWTFISCPTYSTDGFVCFFALVGDPGKMSTCFRLLTFHQIGYIT